MLVVGTSEGWQQVSGSNRSQYSGISPSLWVGRARTRRLWPMRGAPARNNQLAAARTAARGYMRGRGRPRAFRAANWGSAGPKSSSGAHFHVPGHEIGHSDEVSSGCRTNAALLGTEYGYGSELGVRKGTAQDPAGRIPARGGTLACATMKSGSGLGYEWMTDRRQAPRALIGI